MEPAISRSLTVRDCQPEDVRETLDLWQAAAATPSLTDTHEDLLRAIRESPAVVLVAEVDGRIAGSIIASFDGWRANYYRLAVHPDYRRQGIALALVRAAEERLRQQGAVRFSALVEAAHEDAVGFWEAAGYQHDRRIARYVRTLK